MKTDDLLILGGLGFLAYYFLKKKPGTDATVTEITPIYTPLPASTATTSQVPVLVKNVVDVVTKLLPGNAPPPAVIIPTSAPVTPAAPIQDEDDGSTYQAPAPQTFTTAYQDNQSMLMWKNKTYPGAVIITGKITDEDGN